MKLAKKRPEEHTENMYYAKLCFGRAASLGFFPGQMVLVVLKVDELEARKPPEREHDKENEVIPKVFNDINKFVDVHGSPAIITKPMRSPKLPSTVFLIQNSSRIATKKLSSRFT